ncbi:M1 family metallopeptidase [Phaeodactylibacter luteus]|uniref:M1 family metallopeptidase n=1 Tax=Phaeodactylibacter luteus TaxID=1564516 RepID=A0A5C6RLK8_9BACT|nr:M1 family metallopeptidase [Phaeodactylibacter luteus]TXB63271.1 M1 family metallopeptidase [Phaeodactylibacter luteus]
MDSTHLRLFWALFLAISFSAQLSAQYTRQDTLRGSVTPERAWWDLTYYHLDIRVDPGQKFIEGANTIQYRVLKPGQRMQIDLQPPMQLTAAVQNGQPVSFEQEGNVYYLELNEVQVPGQVYEVRVNYSGHPREAVRAPWDGGLSWKTDENGKPFVATSCQGEGASLWWPCKDHMYDEPDSMLISVAVPDTLFEVSNGQLRGISDTGAGTRTFHWFVGNPINNYGVNINIGDYVHFGETYDGEEGELPCDYYVLRGNLEKAKEQFKQVPMMLEAFEHWFGPYPFYEDGFKLVEVPYLGMEHQSSVTYGNGYQNGYRGMDLSGTGWGKKFDFIIIHESGHEWFANNITYKDIADMWVHEGFTAYSENLYLDYHFGKEAAADYVIGTRRNVMNDRPIIGDYGVNRAGSGDMYYKGANMLHTIRTLIGDDGQWARILRGLNQTFYHKTVTTQEIEGYLIEHSGLALQPVLDQYLRDVRIPVLEYRWGKGKTLEYRWADCLSHFDMPVGLQVGERTLLLSPSTKWAAAQVKKKGEVALVRDYYATLREVE